MPAGAPAVAAADDGEGPAPPPPRREGLDQTLVPVGCVEGLFHWNEKEELGSGSFAAVYKAVRKADGEVFAVKCVKKARMETSAQWQQLASEVIICKQLTHPGCVKCYDVFQDEHTVYLVLEWVPGGDLLNAIKTRKAEFTETVVAVFARQILKTLVYLHNEMGIAHRDLKPDNILLTTRDLCTARLKLADFGFAKFFGIFPGSHAVSPAAPGIMVNSPKGSVRYLAPEIIGHLFKKDCKPWVTTRPEQIAKVDMYAAGVVVYVQLCAKFPYKGDKVDAIKRSMDTHPLSFPMPFTGQTLSPLAENFCRWLMEKDPQWRPLALQALRHDWVAAIPPAALPAASPPGSSAAGVTAGVPARGLSQQRRAAEADGLMEELQRVKLQNTKLLCKLAEKSRRGREREGVVVRLREELAALGAENTALRARALEAEERAASAATLADESKEGRMVAENQLAARHGSPLPPQFPGLADGSPSHAAHRSGGSPATHLAPLGTTAALSTPNVPYAVRAEMELQDRDIWVLAKRNVQLEPQLSASPLSSDASGTVERRVQALERELREARALLAVDGLCPQLALAVTAVRCHADAARPRVVMRLGAAEAQLGLSGEPLGWTAHFPLPADPEAMVALWDLRLVLYDAEREKLLGRALVPLEFPSLRRGDWEDWVDVPPASALRFRLRFDPVVPRTEVQPLGRLPAPSSLVAQPWRDPLVLTVMEARGVRSPTNAALFVKAQLGAATVMTAEQHDAVWRQVFVLDDPANQLRLELCTGTLSGDPQLLGTAAVNARTDAAGSGGLWLPLAAPGDGGGRAGELRVRYYTNSAMLALHTRLKELEGSPATASTSPESVPAPVQDPLNDFLGHPPAPVLPRAECDALRGVASHGAAADYEQLHHESTGAASTETGPGAADVGEAPAPLLTPLLTQLVGTLEAFDHPGSGAVDARCSPATFEHAHGAVI